VGVVGLLLHAIIVPCRCRCVPMSLRAVVVFVVPRRFRRCRRPLSRPIVVAWRYRCVVSSLPSSSLFVSLVPLVVPRFHIVLSLFVVKDEQRIHESVVATVPSRRHGTWKWGQTNEGEDRDGLTMEGDDGVRCQCRVAWPS
jgi:hypothetical protein